MIPSQDIKDEFLTNKYLFFGPTESQDVKQLNAKIAILMQNHSSKQPLIETNVHAPYITKIHLAKIFTWLTD